MRLFYYLVGKLQQAMAASTSDNCNKALKKNLVHLKKLVKMDTLMPELNKCHILTSSDHRKLDDKETPNDDKITYLVKVLPQRSNGWWDQLLASLKATDDNQLKLAARILEIEKHSVRHLHTLHLHNYSSQLRLTAYLANKFDGKKNLIILHANLKQTSCAFLPFKNNYI